MIRKCPVCGGEVADAKVRVAPSGKNVGLFEGYRCLSCGEEFLSESSLQPAHEEIVRAGIFGEKEHSFSSTPTIPMTVEVHTIESLTSNDGPRINGVKIAKPIVSLSVES
jgi:hypothetical protein